MSIEWQIENVEKHLSFMFLSHFLLGQVKKFLAYSQSEDEEEIESSCYTLTKCLHVGCVLPGA